MKIGKKTSPNILVFNSGFIFTGHCHHFKVIEIFLMLQQNKELLVIFTQNKPKLENLTLILIFYVWGFRRL